MLQQLVVQMLQDEAVRKPLLDLGTCIVSCLRRSQCPLEMLKIQSSVLTERLIIAILRQAPTLRSLVLSGCGDLSTKMLSTLLTRPKLGLPLHKVPTFVFDDCTFRGTMSPDGHTDMAEQMLDMLRARFNSRATLCEGVQIVLSDCRGIDFNPAMRKALEVMIEEGLKFSTKRLVLSADFDDVDTSGCELDMVTKMYEVRHPLANAASGTLYLLILFTIICALSIQNC